MYVGHTPFTALHKTTRCLGPELCELRRITLLETVWKLRIGSITGSYKSGERGERAPFLAFGGTERRAILPAKRLSRQSLYGVG